MKKIILSLFVLIILVISKNVICQDELLEQEKRNEISRIKNILIESNTNYIANLRNLLISTNNEISKEDFDTLVVDCIPTFAIKKGCSIKLFDMLRIETEDRLPGRQPSHLYDFYIKPSTNKISLYSAISDTILIPKNIYLYKHNGELKYIIRNVSKEIGKPKIEIRKPDKRFNNIESVQTEPLDIGISRFLSRNYLKFCIIPDSLEFDKYFKSADRPKTLSNYYFKDGCLIIFNNKIYSYACLVAKYKTKDFDDIFKNPADSICDCDMDVFFRKNITLEEYKKQIESKQK